MLHRKHRGILLAPSQRSYDARRIKLARAGTLISGPLVVYFKLHRLFHPKRYIHRMTGLRLNPGRGLQNCHFDPLLMGNRIIRSWTRNDIMKFGLYILTMATWISYTLLGLSLFNYYHVESGGWCGTPEAMANLYIMLSSLVVVPLLIATIIFFLKRKKELSKAGLSWSIITICTGGMLYFMWLVIGILK